MRALRRLPPVQHLVITHAHYDHSGGIAVIETPGHSAGQIALRWRSTAGR